MSSVPSSPKPNSSNNTNNFNFPTNHPNMSTSTNSGTLKYHRRTSKEHEDDILVSEKSAKIKAWVVKRLQDLEDQNERLKQQNLRCTNQLKALTSYAERNKHWHNSSLFSQSVTGTLPSCRDFMEQNRTSEDSGLTSDDTSADHKPLKFTKADESIPYSTTDHIHPVMTQSTSALLKRSPRLRNKTPNGRNPPLETQDPEMHPRQNQENSHSSTSDSSPWDEKPKPIPTPRKSKVNSTQSEQNVMDTPVRHRQEINGVERDSLNSYDVEDDYGEYEEDEDEIFEEIDYGDSPVQEGGHPNKKDIRFADYVNLNDFVLVKEPEPSSRISQVYSDINKPPNPDQSVPELPKHKPFMQWEQRLYRNAEKCLSVVEASSVSSSPTPGKQSDPVMVGRSQLDLPLLANAQMNDTLRRVNVTNLAKNGQADFSTPKRTCARENSFGSNECDSGIGRGSNGSGRGSSGLAAVPESGLTPPEGMVLTHPPNESMNMTATNSSYLTSSSVNFGASTSRISGTSSRSDSISRHNNSLASSSHNVSFNGIDSTYAIPPDAKYSGTKALKGPPAIRASLVPTTEMVEKSGHLVELSDNKFRSFKRRYVILRNGKLCFYKKKNDEEASKTINLTGIKSISRVTTKSGVHGFQIHTESERLKYQAESDKATEDWYGALNQALKNLTIAEISQRTSPVVSVLKGWVTKVKRGHQKRYFASLIGQKLLFFKKEDDKIPCSHLFLQGARICEKSKGSSDEYSDSSEDQVEGSFNDSSTASNGYQSGSPDYSICIEIANVDPLYIMLRSSEEKDKWLYYLKMASSENSSGRPFEALVQKLMMEHDPHDSNLWDDALLTTPDENPLDTLTSISNESTKKKALEQDLACFLFTSVLMKPIAVQYHVDLSQNILSSALESDELKNELYAQLIRLTNSSLPYTIQAWKLLALAIPIYLPKQYSILWLLKQHLARHSTGSKASKEHSKMPNFCEQLLFKRQKVGDRREGPSKLEAISILTRDPSNTKLPFSVPILLPSGDYQVVEFDGSTEIGQCLSSLCLKLGLRPALLSGYALYANDPSGSDEDLILLKGKQKLCDCLSAWEKQIKDSRMGRVTTDSCSIKLQLRMRHYWSHLSEDETQMEKIFLCYRMAEEVVEGHLPMSNELAEELCALYAQMCYCDSPPTSSDPQLDLVLSKFYPAKMLEVVNHRSLKETIHQNWSQLAGLTLTECVRMILAVLRKWKFFGAFITTARMKMPSDRKIFIALTDEGIHLLTDKQLDVIRTFPYHRLVNFGEYRDDFMITVSRILPPDAHPEETPRERLTFYMEKKYIEQLTNHLAEYIRCQKLVWKLSMKC